MLDLLEWNRKPSMDGMHKAYVGRSRCREAQHTLIAQPYSPHLLRQGELPGPSLLNKVFKQEMTVVQAKAAWKRHEHEKKRGRLELQANHGSRQ